jgi:drug/metabolite transporter (DMT)-like permease
VLDDVSAFQINLAMGVAMLGISIPATLLAGDRFRFSARVIGVAALVAVMMAVGSLLYALAIARLPAGPTAAIATTYVVITFILSAVFLDERVDAIAIAGIVLTIGGVALLSLRV